MAFWCGGCHSIIHCFPSVQIGFQKHDLHQHSNVVLLDQVQLLLQEKPPSNLCRSLWEAMKFAAEYVLALLASRVYGHINGTSLGHWSLNLSHWPSQLPVSSLFDAVSDLAPLAVHLEVTAGTLSAGQWKPKKDFEANRLVAGRLQLAPGTFVLLDESEMQPGDVNDNGVRALQAIQAWSRINSCHVTLVLMMWRFHWSSNASLPQKEFQSWNLQMLSCLSEQMQLNLLIQLVWMLPGFFLDSSPDRPSHFGCQRMWQLPLVKTLLNYDKSFARLNSGPSMFGAFWHELFASPMVKKSLPLKDGVLSWHLNANVWSVVQKQVSYKNDANPLRC